MAGINGPTMWPTHDLVVALARCGKAAFELEVEAEALDTEGAPGDPNALRECQREFNEACHELESSARRARQRLNLAAHESYHKATEQPPSISERREYQ